MESESSHSLRSPSETPNTVASETSDDSMSRKQARTDSTSKPPVAPKGTRRKSIYWSHCKKVAKALDDGSVHNLAICNYCKVKIPVTYGSTSGLKNHLENKCKSSPLYIGSRTEKGQAILTNETMGQMQMPFKTIQNLLLRPLLCLRFKI